METIETVDILPDLNDLPCNSRHSFALRVAPLADGTTVCLPVNVLVGAQDGATLLMVAGVHGDEYEGITAQLELWESLQPEQVSGMVISVPVANPPAFRARQRRNPEDQVDMNRVFPGNQRGTITEQIAYRLYHDIALRADFVLSMHGWVAGGLVVPYVEYPRQSSVTETSRAAAIAFGLDYIEALDWNPGLLVAVCTQAGIPAIEPEIGGLAYTILERRMLYIRGTLSLMRHLHLLPSTDPQTSAQEVVRQMCFAPVGGVLHRHIELNGKIMQGNKLATITDFVGNPLAIIESPAEGIVAAQHLAAAINPGELVAVIFSEVEG
jgi:hypothetical protein